MTSEFGEKAAKMIANAICTWWADEKVVAELGEDVIDRIGVFP